eukprot:jgi/Chlat1/3992/Chrsp26S03982
MGVAVDLSLSMTALVAGTASSAAMVSRHARLTSQRSSVPNKRFHGLKVAGSVGRMLRMAPSTWRSRAMQSTRAEVAAEEADADVAADVPDFPDWDYYALLLVEEDAPSAVIKQNYRILQKRCHPDIMGEHGHHMSSLLNKAYSTLMDPHLRAAFNTDRRLRLESAFTVKGVSTWKGPDEEQRAVFVDENTCIGCLNCAFIAPETFAIENRHGRARVVHQWGDDKPALDAAIQSCPVSCIFWVDRSRVAALEHVMAQQTRTTPGVREQYGRRIIDVFMATESFLKKRRAAVERRARGSSIFETAAQKAARTAASELLRNTNNQNSWFQRMQEVLYSAAFGGAVDSEGNVRKRAKYFLPAPSGSYSKPIPDNTSSKVRLQSSIRIVQLFAQLQGVHLPVYIEVHSVVLQDGKYEQRAWDEFNDNLRKRTSPSNEDSEYWKPIELEIGREYVPREQRPQPVYNRAVRHAQQAAPVVEESKGSGFHLGSMLMFVVGACFVLSTFSSSSVSSTSASTLVPVREPVEQHKFDRAAARERCRQSGGGFCRFFE